MAESAEVIPIEKPRNALQMNVEPITDLIVAENISPEIFTNGGIQPLLEDVAKRARSFVFDLDTGPGRRGVASLAFKVARSKTLIDDIGKGIVAPLKQKAKKVDAERKVARDFLDGLKAEIRKPLTEWEEAEKVRLAEAERIERERVDGIQNEIKSIREIVLGLAGKTSAELTEIRTATAELKINEKEYQEFKPEAEDAISIVLDVLKGAIEAAEKAEAEAAERKAEEERLAKIAEEQRIEAERLEAERREQERIRSEQEAGLERKRLEIEAAERKRASEARAKHKAEDDRIAAERAKIEADKKAFEQAQLDAKIQSVRDAAHTKALEDNVEFDRKRAEEKAKRDAEEKARAEALKPDKNRLLDLAESIKEFVAPENVDISAFKSQEAKSLAVQAIYALFAIGDNLRADAEAL